jgi:hypothetical protein
MISDTFQYALVTAGIGMGIVFFFLFALSMLMYLIRALLVDRPEASGSGAKANGSGAAGTTGASGQGTAGGGPDTADEHGVPRWALAGAVAYLLEEEREYAPRADAWIGRNDSRRWETR